MPEYKISRAKEGEILTADEVQQLIKNIPKKRKLTKPLISFLWIFGKRISEIIKLKKKHIFIEEGRVNVRFFVLKQGGEGRGDRHRSMISKDHPLAQNIIEHIEKFGPNDYIFPGNQEGHISRQHADNLLKEVDENICAHWFRHSVATRMAEKGATEDELMDWFDWMSAETAHSYVERAGRLSERFADREW